MKEEDYSKVHFCLTYTEKKANALIENCNGAQKKINFYINKFLVGELSLKNFIVKVTDSYKL